MSASRLAPIHHGLGMLCLWWEEVIRSRLSQESILDSHTERCGQVTGWLKIELSLSVPPAVRDNLECAVLPDW